MFRNSPSNLRYGGCGHGSCAGRGIGGRSGSVVVVTTVRGGISARFMAEERAFVLGVAKIGLPGTVFRTRREPTAEAG